MEITEVVHFVEMVEKCRDVPIHLNSTNDFVNPIALRMAKTLWSSGHSECNRDVPRNSCNKNWWGCQKIFDTC